MGVLDEIEGAVFGSDTERDDTINPERRQFSTGPEPIAVAEEWREFSFGFEARSVSIREHTDAWLMIAFEKPWGNPAAHVRLRPQDLPFSIGGETPLGKGQVYVRAAEGEAAEIEVLAI